MLLLCNGCGYNIITKALDKDQLPSSEQIEKLREANLDVYICFTLGGPPPIGNITLIALPKNSKPNFVYAPNCGILQGYVNQMPPQYPPFPSTSYPIYPDQPMPQFQNKATIP